MRDPRFLARHSVKVNVPLAEHLRIGTGGNADFFVTAGTAKTLSGVLNGARDNDLKAFLIGTGSHTVVSDHGFRGIVVKNEIRYCDVGQEQVMAGSALPLAELAGRLSDAGYGGYEAFVGYPGSVGGALRVNLTAGRKRLADHLVRASVYSRGRVVEVGPQDLEFGEHDSRLRRDGEVLLGATFAIAEDDPTAIKRRLLQATQRRLRTEPAGKPCVAVFFDPDGDTAAEMLERAGMAGERIGEAMVSKKNPNFIINEGDARSSSVYELAQRMKHAVTMKLERKLRETVSWVGDW